MQRFSKACLCASVSLMAADAAFAQSDDFTLKVGGRLHIEYTAADFDDTPDGGIESIDATEVRRARIKVSGNYNSDTKYKVEFNTDSSEDITI